MVPTQLPGAIECSEAGRRPSPREGASKPEKLFLEKSLAASLAQSAKTHRCVLSPSPAEKTKKALRMESLL